MVHTLSVNADTLVFQQDERSTDGCGAGKRGSAPKLQQQLERITSLPKAGNDSSCR
jgi:hypothetical protein